MRAIQKCIGLISILALLAPITLNAKTVSKPLPPRKIAVMQKDDSVVLTWNKPANKSYAGFRIYRSQSKNQLGEPVGKIKKKFSFSDSAVLSGQTYYYTVRTVSKSGVESNNKAQVKITIIPAQVSVSQDKLTPAPVTRSAYNGIDVYFVRDGIITYYFDVNLFPNEKIRDEYITKIVSLNRTSFALFSDSLGFTPPFDEIINVDLLDSAGGFSHAAGNIITNRWQTPVDETRLNNLTWGQGHEWVHIFLSGTKVKQGWLEEGLADFIEHYYHYGKQVAPSAGTSSSGYYCRETGWETGYYASPNEFISNSPFVPYSDFSKNPEETQEFYDSRNKSSYYRSAECFWGYIEENFGFNAIKKITRKWNTARTEPEKFLIKDIINPMLETDLSDFVKTRFSYVEL